MKKKVALITQYYPPETGACSARMVFFTRELMNYFENVDVFTPFPNYPDHKLFVPKKNCRKWYKIEKKENLTVFRSRIYPANSRGMIHRAINFISFPVMLLRWIKEIVSHDIFLITSGPMFAGIPVFLLSCFKPIKIILDVRDLWPDRLWETGASNPPIIIKKVLKLYERWMYSKCYCIVTVTQSIKDYLNMELNEKEIFLIRNTDELPTCKICDLKNENIKNKIIIIEAGTQGYAQDPVLLCQTVISLEERYPGRFELYFAGSGVKVCRIKNYALKYDFIHYVGNLHGEKLSNFLMMGDVGVAALSDLPINNLAVPVRLFNYAKSKMAIVFVGAGEAEYILNDTGAGVSVKSGDKFNLEIILERLLLNCGMLNELKAKSINILKGKYGREESTKQFKECIKYVTD